jgi:hypothetical protein
MTYPELWNTKHVTVARIDLDRKFFTRQGMHMNNLGKERIALEMAETATNILWKPEKVISLQWKGMKENNRNDDPAVDNISLQEDPKVTPSIAPNATVDEESLLRPVADVSALTCPVQQITDEQKKCSYGAIQLNGPEEPREQGKRRDDEDPKHDIPPMDPSHSLPDGNTEGGINVMPPMDSICKSNRTKNPLSAKRKDFLWLT